MLGINGRWILALPLMARSAIVVLPPDLFPLQESRNSEEVHRYQVLHVVLQKSAPSLRWRLPVTDHILAHTALADVNTEFKQFAMNSWGPQVGFARLIRRIRSRTSFRTDGRSGWPCRTFHVQKRRKPLRCQAITVSGLTTMSAQRQSAHTPLSQAQRSRSSGVNFGFFTERRRTTSWCRSATFSNWRAAQVLKTDDRATNSAVSISSVRARRLWSLRKPHLLRSFEIYGRHNSRASRELCSN